MDSRDTTSKRLREQRAPTPKLLASTTPKPRWKPEQIWMHRMAVRNRTTKAQLLAVIEKPGSLVEEDELNAAKRKDAYTAMHEIGIAVGGHGAFVLEPELWASLSAKYPYEHKDDSEWIRNEIKRWTSQPSSQISPTFERPAQTPTTAGSSSKRPLQNEELGSNAKRQKAVGKTNFASISGGESSVIQQVSIAGLTLSITEKDQALEENRLALCEKSETIRRQSVVIRLEKDSVQQKEKMIQNLEATNATLQADVTKLSSETQIHKQNIETAIKDRDAARKELADFKAAGLALFSQR
ncbi:hypothetical protein IFR05_015869 [Cadophora sp. M221]|nr:hypothetical protein IFR05_015869 [Cadophora sp. M221]